MVNLLLRLYDLESGRILIDGQDIAGVTQESLRRQVGMVTQDTSLLHRSVRDNIVYGRPDATDADMLRAAERAEATSSSAASPTRRAARATTRTWASAASSSAAASASASPSRA